MGHTVWFDQALSGGQAWWDQILSMIRRCDLFVFVLDPAALDSIACKREYGYATDLRKPILPILVSEGVPMNLLPSSLSQIEFVDYRKQDRTAALRLAKALSAVPAPAPLPDPLPVPPEAPISYLGSLAAKIEATSRLTYKQQSALVVDLKKGLRNPQTADDTQTLLKKLRKRDDLFAAIAEDIDELFEGLREMSPDRGAPPKIEKSLAVAEKGVASSEQSNQEEYKVAQLKKYLEDRKDLPNPWRRIQHIAYRNAIAKAEALKLLRRVGGVVFKIDKKRVRWAKIKS